MTDVSKVNLFSDNLFNTNISENKTTSWRNLTCEERVDIVKQYFTTVFQMKVDENNNICFVSENIDIKTINTIVDIVKSGKLRLKKEVVYDPVNKRIINIKALVCNNNKYVYDPGVLIKKKNPSKMAKSILFRRK